MWKLKYDFMPIVNQSVTKHKLVLFLFKLKIEFVVL